MNKYYLLKNLENEKIELEDLKNLDRYLKEKYRRFLSKKYDGNLILKSDGNKFIAELFLNS
ncbi:MAG: chorismate mutase, partial [Anaerococcus hydrogenalis]|nr:chorismate mutase [Anaerococcus hydrogenalis]